MDLLTILFLIAVFSIFYFLWNLHRPKNWEIMHKIPQPTPKPIVGVAMDIPGSVLGTTKYVFEQCEKFGSPTALKLFGKYFCHIHSPEHFEAMLKDTTNIVKGQPTYGFLRPWLGNGSLLLSDGAIWKRHRKLLTPTFHYRILKDFFPIIHDNLLLVVEKMGEMAKDGGQAFDVVPLITHSALDIIAETSFGFQLGSTVSGGHDYETNLTRFSELVMMRWLRPWLWNDHIFKMTSTGKDNESVIKSMHKFTRKIIHDRDEKKERTSSVVYGEEKQRIALLDTLLELKNKGEISMEEVYNEAETFIFEGHDTTTSAILWGIYALGRNPEIQRKMQQEIDDVLGPNRMELPEPDAIDQLKYFDQCVKETQRLYPSVPLVERTLIAPLKLDENFTIPPDVNISINMWMLHRNKNHWPDPEKFDPDRFNEENSAKRHPFAFCPFSGGARNCIGQKFAYMELKAFLLHIFRNFTVEAVHNYEEMQMSVQFVARPLSGCWIKVKKRE